MSTEEKFQKKLIQKIGEGMMKGIDLATGKDVVSKGSELQMAKREKRQPMFPREVMREFIKQNNIVTADDAQNAGPLSEISPFGVNPEAINN